MINEMPSRVFICQVCSFKLELFHETPEEVHAITNDWCMHAIPVNDATINVVTCPACGEQPAMDIFEGYKKRIRSGEDFRYH